MSYARVIGCAWWLLAALFVVGLPASAQDNPYVFEKPTKRVALVVGNAEYETQAKLPGSADDADNVAKILGDAGFDVIPAKNVKTRSDFIEFFLRPFLDKINEDDFVVFYYSGHGFSYGGETYLELLNSPETISEDKIFSTFVSVTGVRSTMADRKPGFLLMLLDACRNVGSKKFERTAARAGELEKGPKLDALPSGNVVIGFSSDLGSPSIGSSASGKMSDYTAALAKFLPAADKNFDWVQKEVHAEVQIATNDRQKPFFSEGSSAEIYFRPSPEIEAQEREQWETALGTNRLDRVLWFLKRFSVSRYVAAAHKWLTDNEQRVAEPFTRISPLGPELAWMESAGETEIRSIGGGLTASFPTGEGTGEPIKLQRIEGPLAFERVADGRLLEEDEGELGTTRSLGAVGETASEFIKHGEAVLTSDQVALERPDALSPEAASLPAGTRVFVDDLKTDKRKRTWAEVRRPNSVKPVFIDISSTTGSKQTDLGRPLLEVSVGGLKTGLQTLVDAAPINDAVRQLRDDGSTIAWVSIATPSTPKRSGLELFSARADHVVYLLQKNGILRQQVSILQEAPDLQGEMLRVRFFGNGGVR